MVRINEKRLLHNLNELGQIGRLSEDGGGGLDRRPFSPAERAARDYFSQQAATAGLAVVTDPAANLSAKLLSQRPHIPTLLLGSHLDTVPNGGAYDGALGVMAALEVLRTVLEADIDLPVHLEAIAFTDEEGRFGDFFGSQALVGSHTAGSIAAYLRRADAYPDDLVAMRQLVPGGMTMKSVVDARREPASVAGFVELHIEQGPQLEEAGVSIGVVEAIFGSRVMEVVFYGRGDHAGTTPLDLRADALVAASNFVAQAPEIVKQRYPGAVITCGNITVKPGVHNVVPGEATVLVEFRSSEQETLTQMENAILDLLEEVTAGVKDLFFSISPVDQHDPVKMAPAVQDAIAQASQMLSYPSLTLSSGALHDAGLLAPFAPAGMIFVPSIRGRSHCPEEETAAADLVAGANVLLHTALILAQANQ
jgi:N-carbamoyl-L-amino-acid hydrolase